MTRSLRIALTVAAYSVAFAAVVNGLWLAAGLLRIN